MDSASFNKQVSAQGILRKKDLEQLWKFKFENLGLEFRKLTNKDLDQVKQLHHSSFPVKYSQSFYDQLLKGLYVTSLVFHKETDRLVIFGTGRIDNQGDLKKAYVATLGVLPDFRKQGLGILMLREVEYKLVYEMEEAPDCLELHVGSYNTAAMKMYDKAKYTQIKFLPQHYTWDGEKHDGYLYRKQLDDCISRKENPTALSVNELEEQTQSNNSRLEFNFCSIL